jgi:hypothetical protein
VDGYEVADIAETTGQVNSDPGVTFQVPRRPGAANNRQMRQRQLRPRGEGDERSGFGELALPPSDFEPIRLELVPPLFPFSRCR